MFSLVRGCSYFRVEIHNERSVKVVIAGFEFNLVSAEISLAGVAQCKFVERFFLFIVSLMGFVVLKFAYCSLSIDFHIADVNPIMAKISEIIEKVRHSAALTNNCAT